MLLPVCVLYPSEKLVYSKRQEFASTSNEYPQHYAFVENRDKILILIYLHKPYNTRKMNSLVIYAVNKRFLEVNDAHSEKRG